jgi:UDPglucose--hexose-1-phosphate uridylyltransferase
VGGEWVVRIVANKYPAFLEPDTTTQMTPPTMGEDGEEQKRLAIGVHDVVIMGQKHDSSTAQMPVDDLALALHTMRGRALTIIRENERLGLGSITIIENHGKKAGASLSHPHFQIFASCNNVVPQKLAAMAAAMKPTQEAQCRMCEEMKREILAERRVLIESKAFVAWIPFAAESPFHTWIVPRHHSSAFWLCNDDEIKDLAIVLERVLRAINCLFESNKPPPYNLAIVSSPFLAEPIRLVEGFHWHVALNVRVNQPAGFEFGTGMLINPALPEDSARALSEKLAKEQQPHP